MRHPHRHAARRRTALSAIVLVITALTAPAATASPVDAMNRCRANEQGQVVFDYRYEAQNAPAFTIGAGDVYRVVWVNGQIRIGHWPWDPSYNPNGTGWDQPAPSGDYPSWPLPGAPKYGLIAAWGGLPGYFWLGANSPCIQWTGATPGHVAFTQNDNKPSDNSGLWDLELHIYRA